MLSLIRQDKTRATIIDSILIAVDYKTKQDFAYGSWANKERQLNNRDPLDP